MKVEVAILLTTWNSSRYLRELLESLLAQTYTQWHLYVHDDGSTDTTRDILLRYIQADKRISLMDGAVHLGPKRGFMDLLARVEADLYMFCDHDDVWLPSKVADSVTHMMLQPDWKLTPLLVGTDLRVVDANLKPLAESFWKRQHYDEALSNDKWFHLVYNNIPGCTMLFNQAARRVALPCPDGAGMHDSWLMACVLWRGGRVIIIPRSTILYRQHGNNVLGSSAVPSYCSQARRFGALWRKTRAEWQAVRGLANIGFVHFFCVKMYYMARLHLGL